MHRLPLVVCAVLTVLGAPALVSAAVDVDRDGPSAGPDLPYLQCVPYARQISGVRIFGDAHTWWDQAEGKYARGREPRVGAVMAFRASGNMRLGHVAAVSRIIDSRTVLLRHSNWSPINGRRGQIEDNVRAIDVSPGNDWSEVRVWFAPIQGLGTTHWPVRGFIYNRAPGDAPLPLATTRLVRRESPPRSETAGSVRHDDPIGAIIARRTRFASSR